MVSTFSICRADVRTGLTTAVMALFATGCFPDLGRFEPGKTGTGGTSTFEQTEVGTGGTEQKTEGFDAGSGGAPRVEAGPPAADAAGAGANDSGSGGSGNIEAQYLNLRVSLVAMKPHHVSFCELFVIDSNNVIQSRAILDPLGTENTTINMPYAVPKLGGPYRLDFYSDMNGTRSYDGLGSVITNDHAWRLIPLEDYPKGAAHEEGSILVNFVHNTIFTDIDQYPSGTPNKPRESGVQAQIDFSKMTPYIGKFLQLTVLEKVSGHMVGLYRFPSIAEESFTAVLPGIVDIGVDYRVNIYIDANGNGAYDNPEASDADRGWRLDASSDADGIRLSFDPTSAARHSVDVGPP